MFYVFFLNQQCLKRWYEQNSIARSVPVVVRLEPTPIAWWIWPSADGRNWKFGGAAGSVAKSMLELPACLWPRPSLPRSVGKLAVRAFCVNGSCRTWSVPCMKWEGIRRPHNVPKAHWTAMPRCPNWSIPEPSELPRSMPVPCVKWVDMKRPSPCNDRPWRSSAVRWEMNIQMRSFRLTTWPVPWACWATGKKPSSICLFPWHMEVF